MNSDPRYILFEHILQKDNQRLTDPRKILFTLLLDQAPQSTKELLLRAGKDHDRVSLYRNIELFERLDIVQRIPIGKEFKLELSDSFASHHHHIVCNVCSKVSILPRHEQLESAIFDTYKAAGFTPSRHILTLEGRCPDCV